MSLFVEPIPCLFRSCRTFRSVLCTVLICIFALYVLPERASGVIDTDDEESGNGIVTCEAGSISVNARDIRSEELMKEIGEKCGIKIVVYGEVFSEVPISLRFQNMPVRKGIERVLRGSNITNHLMHFKDTDNGTLLVELDLIGEKGGERYLTRASEPRQRPEKEKKRAGRAPPEAEGIKKIMSPDDEKQLQENFLKIMDEVLSSQLEEGAEPDPSEILKMFKEVVPPEMKDQIPQEVLEELERLE